MCADDAMGTFPHLSHLSVLDVHTSSSSFCPGWRDPRVHHRQWAPQRPEDVEQGHGLRGADGHPHCSTGMNKCQRFSHPSHVWPSHPIHHHSFLSTAFIGTSLTLKIDHSSLIAPLLPLTFPLSNFRIFTHLLFTLFDFSHSSPLTLDCDGGSSLQRPVESAADGDEGAGTATKAWDSVWICGHQSDLMRL